MDSFLHSLTRMDWTTLTVGTIVTLVITALITLTIRSSARKLRRTAVYSKVRAQIFQRNTDRLLRITSSATNPERTVIGEKFSFPWITVAFGPFQDRDITGRYSAVERPYWPIVKEWYGKLVDRHGNDPSSGIYNSPGLRLVSFTASRSGAEERPSLILRFCDTNFFYNLVSDQRLDFQFEAADGVITTLREKYGNATDLRLAPYDGNACHFGIQLAVVTKDEKLVIPVRGNTAIARGAVSPSVAEGALPASDIGPVGEYLPNLTASRALREELGIPGEASTTWLSFGANPQTGQYGLVGITHVEETFSELGELFRLAITKDQWENSELYGIAFSPEGLAQFIRSKPDLQWSPFALIAFTHALIDSYGWRRVKNELGSVSPKTLKTQGAL